MKRSNNKQKEMTAALYVRLSRDDNLEGDSYSIGNQKKLLTKIAKEKGYTNLLIFCDDGISGVTMERPGYKAMIEAIENNKSFSRLCKWTFQDWDVIILRSADLRKNFSLNMIYGLLLFLYNIDTQEGENELAPIKNLF